MYSVYDEFGNWVARCADFSWAKKTANHYDGYVIEVDEYGDEWLAYDTREYIYLFSEFY